MKRTQSWRLRRLVSCAAGLALASSTASAATCGERTVSVRGEPARYEVLAKAKARGNWRAQVRALPGLGPLYATWSMAEGAGYSCSPTKSGYICTATARPCRR
jgi:hypothetical protein